MSDGKSFAPKKPLSDAERLNDLERKYGVVQERIQTYDKILLEFAELRKSYSQLSNALQSHVKSTQDAQSEMRNIISSFSSSNRDNASRITALFTSLQDANSRIESICKLFDTKFDSISSYLANIPEHIKKLIESTLSVQEFTVYKSNQKDIAIEQAITNQQTKESFAHLEDSISSLSKSLTDRKNMLNEHGKAISSFLVWINGYEDKVDKRIKEFQLSVSSKAVSDQKDLLRKLDAMKIELLGTPTSNASVEDRIMSKLEIATTEASNAVRMMQVSQDRLKLLEKKMESLQTNQDRMKLLEKKIESLTTQLTKYEIK